MGTVKHFDSVLKEAKAITTLYADRLDKLLAQLPG
jgi:hypothetical protein